MLNAVREMGRQHDVVVVTTDLFPSLVPWIRDGSVAATVCQRPLSQGRLALQPCASSCSTEHPRPPIKVIPHLVMRSDVDLILERSRVDETAS